MVHVPALVCLTFLQKRWITIYEAVNVCHTKAFEKKFNTNTKVMNISSTLEIKVFISPYDCFNAMHHFILFKTETINKI